MAQGTTIKHKKKTKSVLKNIRQSAHRAAINRMNRTRVRTSIRRMRAALTAGDTATAEKLASATFSDLDKAIRKRTLTENTANRYKSQVDFGFECFEGEEESLGRTQVKGTTDELRFCGAPSNRSAFFVYGTRVDRKRDPSRSRRMTTLAGVWLSGAGLRPAPTQPSIRWTRVCGGDCCRASPRNFNAGPTRLGRWTMRTRLGARSGIPSGRGDSDLRI